MGVDISMSMGWGVHISQEDFAGWTNRIDPEGDGDHYEALDRLIYREHGNLVYEWAGNSWIGEDNGLVMYAKETHQGFDMGRSAEAGVYRAPKSLLSVEARRELAAACKELTGEDRPVEWLVTVGVS